MHRTSIAAQPVRLIFGPPLHSLLAGTVAALSETAGLIQLADENSRELRANPGIPAAVLAIGEAHASLVDAHDRLRTLCLEYHLREGGDIIAAPVAELAPRIRAASCLRCDSVPCCCPPLPSPAHPDGDDGSTAAVPTDAEGAE